MRSNGQHLLNGARGSEGRVPTKHHPVGDRRRRCTWAETADPLLRGYHDQEWGVPVHKDRTHFEFLLLEGAQAGLSWSTILKKRAGYRRAFSQFDPAEVARYSADRRRRLVEDPGIVRHRLKVESAVGNARSFLAVEQEFESFDRYVWRFVDGSPLQNRRTVGEAVPARTAESDALSSDLKARGFRFVGSTIVYAYMQAVGLVNDHLTSCFRYPELYQPRRRWSRSPE